MCVMELPKRKQIRLKQYDYKTASAYFVTICTTDRKKLLWDPAGAAVGCPEDVPLSRLGAVVKTAIMDISEHYPAVSVAHYVIMPDHIHLLLQIHTDPDGRPMVAPTLSTIIQQMKGSVTKKVGFPLWQKGFYDHVIRGEADYREIWKYIDGNPAKWDAGEHSNNKVENGNFAEWESPFPTETPEE